MPRLAVLAFAFCLASTILGCKREGAAPQAAPPPPEVTVAPGVLRDLPWTMEFTGTTRPFESVEIRARVRGFIAQKLVAGGDRVQADQPLFEIDPREYQATVSQMDADVAAKSAALRLAEVTLQRMVEAAKQNAVSKLEADRAQADRDAAAAQVQLSEARLTQARLDLEWTRVKSPIAGRLALRTPDAGTLVGAGEMTLLTTVVDDSKIYATYTISESDLLELRRANENRRPNEDGRGALVVRLGLANEQGYPHEGRFVRGDNTVDPATGTITVESVFDNPGGVLLGGLYVRVQAILGERSLLMVPEGAVQRDQRGRFLWLAVPDAAGNFTAQMRRIEVGSVIGGERAIVDGLELADRVITNGFMRVRPGMVIKPAAPK